MSTPSERESVITQGATPEQRHARQVAEKAAEARAVLPEALERVEAYLHGWRHFEGGRSLARGNDTGTYLMLRDVRTLTAIVRAQHEGSGE